LIGNEYGVGVSNRGVLAAQAGDLTLKSNGQLVLAGTTQASGSISANAAQGIENSGTTYAQRDVVVATSGSLTNSGTLAAQQNTSVNAGRVSSTGTLGAGVNNDGTVAQGGDLTVMASGALNANGLNVAGGNATLAGGNVNLAGSQTAANGNVSLTANAGNLNLAGATTSAGRALNAQAAGALINDHGALTAGSGATLTAGSVSNQGGQVSSQGSLVVQSAGQIANQSGSLVSQGAMQVRGGVIGNNQGTMQSAAALSISGASLDNTAGRIASLNGDGLTVTTTGTLTNVSGTTATGAQGGVIGGNGTVTLQGASIANHGAVTAQTDLQVTGAALDNNGGTLDAANNATVSAGAHLSNNGGSITAGQRATVSAVTLDNSGGSTQGAQLSLTAANLVNHAGVITQTGAGPMNVAVSGTLDNSGGGTLETNSTDLTLISAAINNDGGTITHAGAGTLAVNAGNGAGALSNAGGTIQSNGQVVAWAGSLNNASGSVIGQNGITATVAGALNNANGKLLSNKDLSLASGTLTNNGGQIGAGADAVIRSGSLTNNGGSIAASNLSVTTGGTLDNSGGGIAANQLALTATNLLNHGGAITQYGASPMGFAVSGTFDNSSGGTLETNSTDLALNSATVINDNGTITHAGNGTLTVNAGNGAGALSNAGGTIQSNGQVVARAGTLNNASGSVIGQNGLTATVAGALDNANGKLLSNKNLSLASGTLTNNGGQIGASADAAIQTGSLTNNGGSIVASNVAVTTSGTLDNSGGGIEANQLALTATNLLNHGGAITQYGVSPMGFAVSGTFDNSGGGTLETNSTDLTLNAATLINDNGTITHAGDGTLTVNAGNGAGALSNAGGTIESNGQVVARAGSLNNASGSVIGQNGLSATVAGALNNANGKLLSNKDLSLASGTLINNVGQIGASANATIQTGSLTNNGGSIVAPNLTMTTGDTLDNSGGDIEANQLALTATDLLNRGGAITQYGASPMGFNLSGTFDNSSGGTLQTNSTDLALNSATVDNDGGTITHAGAGTLTVNAGNGAGTLSNAGGTIQSNGQIVARAGALNNASGTVIGQNGLTATVAGALDNANGELLSNKDLSLASSTLTNNGGQIGAGVNATIQTGSLTNNGGSIVAPNLAVTTGDTLDNSGGDIEANQLALTATDLLNHGGAITQYGASPMGFAVSGMFDNSNGGTLQTNSTDLALTPATLINDNGTILAAGAGTLTIAPGNGAGAFSNAGGTIIAAGRIDTRAASLNNANGVLAAQGNLAVDVAAGVDNTQGAMRSLSSLSLASGGALTNTNGQIQSGTGAADDASTLDVRASSVDNTRGLVSNLGAGDATVRGGSQTINTGGVITGNGDVAVQTSALVNTQGAQLSGANVAVKADTVDNSAGQIGSLAGSGSGSGSDGDVAITTTGALTNTNGQIGATHDLSVNAAVLTGGGAYSAAHDVALSVQGDFAPTADLQFAAGHDLTFTLPGTFTNSATLEAVNNLGINASDITNSGVMMAGGTLTTHSATLDNTGAIVGGSVSLNATQTLKNVGPTALIGATDSDGTLELLAPDIENRDDTTMTDTQATTAIFGLGKVVLAGGKDANGDYTNANLIRNQSALIESAGDMELHADQVTNTRTVVTTTGLNQPVDPALLEQLGISMSGCTAVVMAACSGQIVGWTHATPDMIGGVSVDPPHGGQWNSGYQYTTYTGVALANLIAGVSPQAQIVAGGDLNAASVGLFQNYWSAVAAVGDIGAAVSLDQNSWRGRSAPEVQVTYSGYYHYTNYDNSIRDWSLPFGNAPFVGGRPGGYTQASPADIRDYALPSYESSFVAGGTLSGTGISINNTAGNAGMPSIGLAPGQALSGVTIAGVSGNASGANASGVDGVSGNAGGTKAGGVDGVSGNAGGTKAGGVDGVSGNAGGTKAGAVSVDGGTAMVNPIIASATALNVLSNLTIPQGGLFSPATIPNATYLIATNPAFTNQKTFISSDYYLQQLGVDPQRTEKRLGDGFYEQQLVRNQITSLTGKAVLGPYTNLEAMYEALLATGASLAQSLNLPLGMSLSPEQVGALTSNVIIMQTQIVDGQSVLVPVVYLAKNSQQNMNGPLIAATDIDFKNAQTFVNSGTVQAGNTLSIDGKSIDNAFGALQSGGLMSLTTKGNVDLTSATVNAGSLALKAGGDLILNTAAKTVNQVSATGATRTTTTLGPLANLNVAGDAFVVTGGNFEQKAGNLNVGGNLGMAVGGDWNLGTVQIGEHKVVERANGGSNTDINRVTGSSVKVGGLSQIGVGGDLTATGAAINLGGGGVVVANGNVTLQAAKATSTIDSNSSGSDSHGSYSESLHRSDDALTATTLNAGNSLTVVSGKDINLTGSAISLDKGTATLAAAGDVNVGAATETHVDNSQETHSHKNVVSGKEVASSSNTSATLSQGSLISADAVTLASGKDINVTGSTIVGTNDVSLSAAHDVNITTSQDTVQSSGSHQEKRTGFGTSGLSVTYGSNDTATTDQASSVTNHASTVGSINGNLSIQAGNTLHVTGSDLLAGKDVTGVAANVIIDSATDTAQRSQTQTTHSSGLTLGLSGSVGDAINNAYAQGKAAGHSADSGNDRASALHAIAAAGDTAMVVAGATGGTLMQSPSIGVQASVGSSSSRNDSSESQTINRGSNVAAGGTAAFVATDGNVNIAGSNVSANDVVLAAKNQVNIVNTTDTASTRSSNSSNSASVGVSVTTNGMGISAAMSNAHGDSNSDAKMQNASHISGANSVTIASGGDTNIIGSQIAGKQITADVGGNLNIVSVQDTTTSAAHQSSAGGGFSISQTGGGASVTAQYGHADSDYAQVKEQAGLYAGEGGFNVNVKGNTDLTGAVISSAADASKNSLSTGTLTFSDLENHSHYSANSMGVSYGLSPGATSDKAVGPASVPGAGGLVPMMAQSEHGDQSATTRSAVSAGTIAIKDKDRQTQDVASLSRDMTNTNGTVGNTPDVNDILNKQADTMQAAQAAGQVVAQGIGAFAEAQRNVALVDHDQATADAWAEGGDNRVMLHVAGGALIGGLGGGSLGAIGGAAGAGVSAALAPKLNELSGEIGGVAGNATANVLAGLAGAAVGGSAGAAAASNADMYNRQLHPDERKWIKDNATQYAKQQGITVDQAVAALTAQADRQVQNGSAGAWDQSASAYLSQAHGMLSADGNSGPGYMFYATPDQKANASMYAGYYPNGVGPNQPGKSAITNSANRDAASRDAIGKETMAAGVAAGLISGGAAVAAVTPSIADMLTTYKAGQAAYSLNTAALTGGAVSGSIYTGIATGGALYDAFRGGDFGSSFNGRFSVAGLATASTVGALNAMFGTSMFKWADIPNGIGNIATVPGVVIRANGIAAGQAAGRAAQGAVKEHNRNK
ncbi:hemagglutinin repeat-containing protein, partial [Caballeronia glebae]